MRDSCGPASSEADIPRRQRRDRGVARRDRHPRDAVGELLQRDAGRPPARAHRRALGNQELSAYGHEVQVGGRGGPQGCYGDSGGALLQRNGDGYEIVGVASNGPEGWKSPCILGERFVRASAQVVDAIEARATTADPLAVVACDAARGGEIASCSGVDVVACRDASALGKRSLRQRVERCSEQKLACKATAGVAACR